MSGQAGIYYFDQRPIDRALARRLGETLAEQGPDGGSEHFGPGLLMVYRAFNFDPLSRSERQPYQSAKGNWITFDGRLDNRDDLVLLAGDYLREDKTDVALALAAYEKWGEPGLNRLLGDWSVAIWDAEKRSIVLASDYMGIRALWYFANNDFIAWSSDLKLLAEWMDVEEKLDNYYIAAYLQGNPRYHRTIYQGIQYVPCGETIRAEGGKLAGASFWSLPVEGRIRYKTTEDYAEHLLHLFREAVLARLRTDRVACCDLSGGLDSSSITCMAHHLVSTGAAAPRKLMSFSVLSPPFDDSPFIEIVEEFCGLDRIRCGGNTVWSLDLPAGTAPGQNSPSTATREAAFAERGVCIGLSGQGGDQVMGNFPNDIDQLADYLHQGAWGEFFSNAYTWSRVMRVPIWRIFKQGIIPLMPTGMREALWKKKIEIADRTSHIPKLSCLNNEFIARYADLETRSDVPDGPLPPPSQRNFAHIIAYSRNQHAFSSFSAQGGVPRTHPYYHRPLVEFVVNIPREELCRPGEPRRLMRRAFAGFLPTAILNRETKATGGTVTDLNAQDLVPVLLEDPVGLQVEQRGFVNGPVFRQVLKNIQAPNHRRGERYRLLNMEMWLRTRHLSRPVRERIAS